MSSSEKSPILNAQVARRILVCSPSNHAVDELAWKLHKSALGTNGKPGSFNIIRFGMLPGEERVSELLSFFTPEIPDIPKFEII